MRGRRFSQNTISKRLSVAHEWVRLHPDLDAATFRDVERWAASKGVSPGGHRNLIVNLRAFYRWLQREELTRCDPTQLADRPPIPAYLPRPAPEADIAAVFGRGDARLRAMVALMACGGLRCVECSRLSWPDVNLAEGTIIVNGKGQRERLVDLAPDAVRALAELGLASGGRRVGPVFMNQFGHRMSPAAVSTYIRHAFRHVGATTRAHQLRHRAATQALRQPGADLLAVRDFLGHVSVATTQVYTRVVPGRTATASRSLTMPAA